MAVMPLHTAVATALLLCLMSCSLPTVLSIRLDTVEAHALQQRAKRAQAHPVENLAEFYHTSESLMEAFNALSASCPGVSISTESRGDLKLPFVRLASRNPNPAHRVLVFCGEHARELISPESGLALFQRLCSSKPEDKAVADEILNNAEVTLFPNINQSGRKKVEAGQYCVRSNENGVDLNRNWDDHWKEDENRVEARAIQSSGGSRPFSELETVILKGFSDKYKPTVFLTVHSGTLGMYMPYAYSGELPKNIEDRESMMGILTQLNSRYCACAAGPAGKEVGYLCPGTCLDYMYDRLRTRHSYGFEIWDGETGVGFSNVKSTALLEETSYVSTSPHTVHASSTDSSPVLRNRLGAHRDFWFDHDEFRRLYASSFLETEVNVSGKNSSPFPAPSSDVDRSCLVQFNPTTKADFEATLRNWSKAFMDIILLSMKSNVQRGH